MKKTLFLSAILGAALCSSAFATTYTRIDANQTITTAAGDTIGGLTMQNNSAFVIGGNTTSTGNIQVSGSNAASITINEGAELSFTNTGNYCLQLNDSARLTLSGGTFDVTKAGKGVAIKGAAALTLDNKATLKTKEIYYSAGNNGSITMNQGTKLEVTTTANCSNLTMGAGASVTAGNVAATGTVSMASGATMTLSGTFSGKLVMEEGSTFTDSGTGWVSLSEASSVRGMTVQNLNFKRTADAFSVDMYGTNSIADQLDLAGSTNDPIKAGLNLKENATLSVGRIWLSTSSQGISLEKNATLTYGNITIKGLSSVEGALGSLVRTSGSDRYEMSQKTAKISNAEVIIKANNQTLANELDGVTLTGTNKNVTLTGTIADSLLTDVTLKGATIATGTTSLNGGGVTGTLTNNGTLNLSGNIALVGGGVHFSAYGEDAEHTSESGNGYAFGTGTYQITTPGSTGTVNGNGVTFTLSHGYTSDTVDSTGVVTVDAATASGNYFVNTGSLSYTAGSVVASDATTAIIVASETTITMGTGTTLNHNMMDLLASTTVTGSGNYIVNGAAEMNNVEALLGQNLKFSGDGMVVTIAGGSFKGIDFIKAEESKFGGAAVEMNGITGGFIYGWDGDGNTAKDVDRDIILTDTESNASAWIWSQGTSVKANRHTVTFSGDWSGEGTFENAGATYAENFKWSGDISNWEGAFKLTGNTATSDVTFTGSATQVNASLTAESGTTLNVIADNDTHFNKTVTATTFKVNSGKSTELNAGVTLGTMLINDESSAKLGDTYAIETLKVAEGATASITVTATAYNSESRRDIGVGKDATHHIGNVIVNTEAALSFNAADVKVDALTLSAGSTVTLGAAAEGEHNFDLTTSDLTVNGNANINADLVVNGGTLTFADNAVLTMGCDVTIGDTVTVMLTDTMVESIMAGDYVEIIAGVDNAYLSQSLTFIGSGDLSDYVSRHADEYALKQVDGKIYITPEPATATLSLLALAGLCARRRRR